MYPQIIHFWKHPHGCFLYHQIHQGTESNPQISGHEPLNDIYWDTVGRNPAITPVEVRLVIYSTIYRVFLHSRWCRISAINSIIEYEWLLLQTTIIQTKRSQLEHTQGKTFEGVLGVWTSNTFRTLALWQGYTSQVFMDRVLFHHLCFISEGSKRTTHTYNIIIYIYIIFDADPSKAANAPKKSGWFPTRSATPQHSKFPTKNTTNPNKPANVFVSCVGTNPTYPRTFSKHHRIKELI